MARRTQTRIVQHQVERIVDHGAIAVLADACRYLVRCTKQRKHLVNEMASEIEEQSIRRITRFLPGIFSWDWAKPVPARLIRYQPSNSCLSDQLLYSEKITVSSAVVKWRKNKGLLSCEFDKFE